MKIIGNLRVALETLETRLTPACKTRLPRFPRLPSSPARLNLHATNPLRNPSRRLAPANGGRGRRSELEPALPRPGEIHGLALIPSVVFPLLV
jgi:hypothetical protein